jgi:hypothetical protein
VLGYLALGDQRLGVSLLTALAALTRLSKAPNLGAHLTGYPLEKPAGTACPDLPYSRVHREPHSPLVVFVAIRRVAVIWAIALVAGGFVVIVSGHEATGQFLIFAGGLLGVVGGGYGRT